MIDTDEPHPNLVCGICDDNDHCLPRWEDDGGEIEPAAVARAGVRGGLGARPWTP